VERVRVRNTEEFSTDDDYADEASNNQLAAKIFQIDARGIPIQVASIDSNLYASQQVNGGLYEQQIMESSQKKFVVKLFPYDENEKEIQEMTMFVESNDNQQQQQQHSQMRQNHQQHSDRIF
jgi:hypothetical protein